MFKFNLNTYDHDKNKFALITEPDVCEVKFSSDSGAIDFIVMGCDGIWDGTDHTKQDPNPFNKLPQGY